MYHKQCGSGSDVTVVMPPRPVDQWHISMHPIPRSSEKIKMVTESDSNNSFFIGR